MIQVVRKFVAVQIETEQRQRGKDCVETHAAKAKGRRFD